MIGVMMHGQDCVCKNRRLVSLKRAMARKRGWKVVHLSHAEIHKAQTVLVDSTTITISVKKCSLARVISDHITTVKSELMDAIKFMIGATAHFEQQRLSPRPR